MTVTNSKTKVIHKINKDVDRYHYPFKLFKSDELLAVAINPDDDVQITLILNSDYQVNGLGQDIGGQIIFTKAGLNKIKTGWNLVLIRQMSFEQQIDYRPFDLFPAETHERALDILTMQDQQLKELVERAMLAPLDSDAPPTFSEFKKMQQSIIQAVNQAEDAAQKTEDILSYVSGLTGELSPATKDQAGMVSIGENVKVTPAGRISVPLASQTEAGVIKVGDNLSIDESGRLKADQNSYSLPPATVNALGGIMAQDGLTILPNGGLKAKLGQGLTFDENRAIKVVTTSNGLANKLIITSSKTWIAPQKGVYIFTLIGGGGGGGRCTPAYPQYAGGGGGSGAITSYHVYLEEATSVEITIGAGGIAKSLQRGGGETKIAAGEQVYTAGGGGGGGDGFRLSNTLFAMGGGGGAGGLSGAGTSDNTGYGNGGSNKVPVDATYGGFGGGVGGVGSKDNNPGGSGGDSFFYGHSRGGSGGSYVSSSGVAGLGGQNNLTVDGNKYGFGGDGAASTSGLGRDGLQGCVIINW